MEKRWRGAREGEKRELIIGQADRYGYRKVAERSSVIYIAMQPTHHHSLQLAIVCPLNLLKSKKLCTGMSHWQRLLVPEAGEQISSNTGCFVLFRMEDKVHGLYPFL